jgi:lipopolysaccharide assembly protein A
MKVRMDMDKLKLISVLVLAAFIIIVSLQNTADVSTRILFFTVTMPRFVLLLITAVFGFIIGVLFSLHFLDKPDRKRLEEKPPY